LGLAWRDGRPIRHGAQLAEELSIVSPGLFGKVSPDFPWETR
jgi:hypothetical protein